MDRFKQIETFVAVAAKGSLSAAAALEGVAPAVISRRIDALEAEVDPSEDVARVVAHDARRVSGLREASRQRIEVLRALLPRREHRPDAVMMRMASGQDRHPRGEGAWQRDVRAVEARRPRSELREIGSDARVDAIASADVS